MDRFLNSGITQLLGILITALSAWGVARFTRSGAREANQTTGWTNLVAALQKEVGELRVEQARDESTNQARFKELDQGNRELAARVFRLERSRYRWRHWAQQVVRLMEAQGITFPPPPESLEDTDPSMTRS
jgi:hypothetical protein